MDYQTYYKKLKKPSFAPPGKVFPIIWTILYPIIFISFAYVFFLYFKHEIPLVVIIPFILNLLFNFIFTPLQFNLRNNIISAIDISLVIVTLIWAIVLIYPYAPLVAYVQIPYLLWGLFATVLQFSITYLNTKK
jgi:tryptophan-rich sensory protein